MKHRLEQLDGHGNDELLKECRERSGIDSFDIADASILILKMIGKKCVELTN